MVFLSLLETFFYLLVSFDLDPLPQFNCPDVTIVIVPSYPSSALYLDCYLLCCTELDSVTC